MTPFSGLQLFVTFFFRILISGISHVIKKNGFSVGSNTYVFYDFSYIEYFEEKSPKSA